MPVGHQCTPYAEVVVGRATRVDTGTWAPIRGWMCRCAAPTNGPGRDEPAPDTRSDEQRLRDAVRAKTGEQ